MLYGRLSATAARRPLPTLAIVLVLALAGGAAALRLSPSTGLDTFVGASSPAARATATQERLFGSDPVVVIVRQPLPTLLAPGSLATLARLEACLAGQYTSLDPSLGAYVPIAHAPYGGPAGACGQLARSHAVKVVYGPATFLNRAVAAINAEIRAVVAGAGTAVRVAEQTALHLSLARGLSRARALREAAAAGSEERARQLATLEQLALSSGLRGAPSIDDRAFVDQLVLDPTRGDAPRPQLAYVFPNASTALIQVRLRAGLSATRRARAIASIRRALRIPALRLQGGSYIVAGEPVVLDGLASQVTHSIATLLAVAIGVMALTLLAVFRARLRLLPLAVALAAAAITFGLAALVHAGLTVASIAVAPILIGLAVDYAVQFQARVQEQGRVPGSGGPPARDPGGLRSGRPTAAAGSGALSAPVRGTPAAMAAARAAPAIGTAAAATATGFLVLVLSPVPMVRGFGLVLVAGIVVAFACALVAVPAALALGAPGSPRPGRVTGLPAASVRGAWELLGPSFRGAWAMLAPSLRGAAELGRLVVRPARRVAGGAAARVVGGALAHPGRALAIAAAVAALGWVADGRTAVQSDVVRLVGSDTPALRALQELQRVTGVSGEIDLSIRGRDVTSPAVVGWMEGYESRVLRHFGYTAQHGCARALLCPALSLPDLLSGSGALSRARIDSLLASVPSYFTRAVVTANRRAATLAFGIRLLPLARQQRVISYLRAQLHPPPGTRAALAGLPVLAAQAASDLSSGARRVLMLVAALIAVAAVLLVVLRSPRRALAPMVPIVLATGWSSLIVYLTGVALNPMSVTLGTLVIAISTEFSVLLAERHRQEREAGHDLREALSRAYRSTGTAVLASGVTAIAGFAVLLVSSIPMLRDFGLVTVVDLSVSLAGVLIVLPAALSASERGARGRLRSASVSASARRRRTRVA